MHKSEKQKIRQRYLYTLFINEKSGHLVNSVLVNVKFSFFFIQWFGNNYLCVAGVTPGCLRESRGSRGTISACGTENTCWGRVTRTQESKSHTMWLSVTETYKTNNPRLKNQKYISGWPLTVQSMGMEGHNCISLTMRVFGEGVPAPLVMLSFSLSVPDGHPCLQHRVQEVPCRDPKGHA